MWIAFRVLVLLVALAARVLGVRRKWSEVAVVDGRRLFGRVGMLPGARAGRAVGVELSTPIRFDLSRETVRDRWFKRIGLSREMQTGDRSFDGAVYVVGDHPRFRALLRQSAEARAAVKEALWARMVRIRNDGRVLWLWRAGSAPLTVEDHLLATNLARALSPLERERGGLRSDPFALRAIVLEGIAWSLAAYAVSAVVGVLLHPERVVLDFRAVAIGGLAFAAVLWLGLCVLAVVLLRGSSRGHRVILESALVVTLSAPVAGPQAVVDVNRAFDASHVEHRELITSCDVRTSHRTKRGRRKGRRSTTYSLVLDASSAEQHGMPDRLKTNAELCQAVQGPVEGTFVVGRGALGIRWIREIRLATASWTS